MEPEKFEEYLRNHFQEREIKPSAAAWKKLEQRLEKKPGFRNLWIGLAAAGVAVFLLLTFQKTDSVQEAPLVNTPVFEVEKESKAPNKDQISEPATEEKTKLADNSGLPAKEPFTPIKVDLKTRPVVQAVQRVEALEPRMVASDYVPSQEVSDAEIEALLAEARSEIALQASPGTDISLSPENLLEQVEDELEQSFRQKVFEVLQEGYSKARTAVANRNF